MANQRKYMRRVLVRRRRLRNRSRKEADGWSSVVGGEKLSLMEGESSTIVRPFSSAADFKRAIACSDLPLKSIHLGDSGTRAGIANGMINKMMGTEMASRRWFHLGKSQAIPATVM